MTNTRTYVIVLLAALLFLLYSAVFIVDQRERALVVRLGEIQRTSASRGCTSRFRSSTSAS